MKRILLEVSYEVEEGTDGIQQEEQLFQLLMESSVSLGSDLMVEFVH